MCQDTGLPLCQRGDLLIVSAEFRDALPAGTSTPPVGDRPTGGALAVPRSPPSVCPKGWLTTGQLAKQLSDTALCSCNRARARACVYL